MEEIKISSLNRYSQQIAQDAVDKDAAQRKAELEAKLKNEIMDDARLTEMEVYGKESISLSAVFSAMLPDNTLVYYEPDEKIWYKMAPEDLARDGRTVNTPGAFINVAINVTVKSVDVENRTVWLKRIFNVRTSARVLINHEIDEAFAKAKKEGKDLRIPGVAGTVITIHPTYAVINIAGKGVIGILRKRDWCDSYVYDLNRVMKDDAVYTFDITDATVNAVGVHTYTLDHKPYSISPWDKLTEDIKPGTNITVTCTAVNLAGNSWHGQVSEGSTLVPEGLEVFGLFKNTEDALIPQVGHNYLCVVSRFNRNNKFMQVQIYRNLRESAIIPRKPLINSEGRRPRRRENR